MQIKRFLAYPAVGTKLAEQLQNPELSTVLRKSVAFLMQGDALALQDDALTLYRDAMALQGHALTLYWDALPLQRDALTLYWDALPLQKDALILLGLTQNISQTLISPCRASCYKSGNPPNALASLCLCGSLFRNLCVSPNCIGMHWHCKVLPFFNSLQINEMLY
ncbi:MAG: hypothetical protein V7K41_21700 [Nostoc sp.]|uniref:hypothetical protein n=1 Tax=Nostoc sp. TaxID=1180 RepID=UPI002FF45560